METAERSLHVSGSLIVRWYGHGVDCAATPEVRHFQVKRAAERADIRCAFCVEIAPVTAHEVQNESSGNVAAIRHTTPAASYVTTE
jgi:hypothetical protein